MPSIVDLPRKVSKLPKPKKELVNRFFTIDSYTGKLKIPKDMVPWIKKQFGSVSSVTSQKIIRIENNFTHESSIFNELRGKRPIVSAHTNVDDEINKHKGGPFCKPKKLTPEDTFGRVKGKHSITASNIAKYDKWHGLIIFDEHNPLKLTKNSVVDYFETAQKWLAKAQKEDKTANFPFIMWHCLWKSAASIIHGHMQVSLARKSHYPNVKLLNNVRNDYKKKFGTDYFEDLFKVHEFLGLAKKRGNVKIISHLTPKKEKEILLISSKPSKQLYTETYNALSTLQKLGVDSFTLGAYLAPLKQDKEWKGFPAMIRIIDRGPLSQKTSDMASMEIYGGMSVVASDPYAIFRKLI